MSFSTVIFDLDGTLLDTIEDIADTANASLRAMGFPPHAADAYKAMVGDGAVPLARRALPEGRRDEATVLRWLALVDEASRRSWPGKTRPYDGVPELLDELTRRGVKLTILSNRPEGLTKMMVADMLAHWRFETVVGARDDAPSKPNPAGAIAIAKGLGCAPEACLFLGDSDVDMQAAAAAGMFPVGALWGFRTAEELSANGARALLRSPTDLLALMESRNV